MPAQTWLAVPVVDRTSVVPPNLLPVLLLLLLFSLLLQAIFMLSKGTAARPTPCSVEDVGLCSTPCLLQGRLPEGLLAGVLLPLAALLDRPDAVRRLASNMACISVICRSHPSKSMGTCSESTTGVNFCCCSAGIASVSSSPERQAPIKSFPVEDEFLLFPCRVRVCMDYWCGEPDSPSCRY